MPVRWKEPQKPYLKFNNGKAQQNLFKVLFNFLMQYKLRKRKKSRESFSRILWERSLIVFYYSFLYILFKENGLWNSENKEKGKIHKV